MNNLNKPINWFEIPATDLQRAQAFYETILGVHFRGEQMGPTAMAIFPYDQSEAAATGGALVAAAEGQASLRGTIVYLNASPLDGVLARVEGAGGKIMLPKTKLPGDIGFIAHIADTEGNRVGLHGEQ